MQISPLLILSYLILSPDVDTETFSPADDSVFDPAAHEDEGSNLVAPRPSVVIQEPTLLDLPRDPVDRELFESYTYTGRGLWKLNYTHVFSPALYSKSQTSGLGPCFSPFPSF